MREDVVVAVIAASLAVGAAACRRDRVPRLIQPHYAELLRIADEANKLCDALLANPECEAIGSEQGAPPLPPHNLAGAVGLVNVAVDCAIPLDDDRPYNHCVFRNEGPKPVTYYPPECERARMSTFPNGPRFERGKPGQGVIVSDSRECGWIQVRIERITPGGAETTLVANFRAAPDYVE